MSISFARRLHAAATNELDNLAQLVAIEPGTMLLADIDNDAGAIRKIDPIHQLPAMRAGNITHLFLMRNWRAFFFRDTGTTENDGLVLTISANQLEDDCVEPQ